LGNDAPFYHAHRLVLICFCFCVIDALLLYATASNAVGFRRRRTARRRLASGIQIQTPESSVEETRIYFSYLLLVTVIQMRRLRQP
jgi:hypothetical protein